MLVGARTAMWSEIGKWVNPYQTADNSMIFHFDGEWNEGIGGEHSDTTEQWIDLVRGIRATWRRIAPTWNEKSAIYNNRLFWEFYDDVVMDAVNSCSATYEAVVMGVHVLTGNRSVFCAWNYENFAYWSMQSLRWGSVGGNYPSGWKLNERLSFAIRYDKDQGKVAVFINGEKAYEITALYRKSLSDNHFAIGSLGSLSDKTDEWSGDINCVRMYNRPLTDAEIANNYAIDKARFGLP